MVLPDRIELSTSPLPTVGSKVRSACAAAVFLNSRFSNARILHGLLKVPAPQRFLVTKGEVISKKCLCRSGFDLDLSPKPHGR
jgi:hypothetical protein